MVLNIVGLEISVPEFIWTVINFFILLFLLKKFLYDPVLKFMDERSARIASGLAEGKNAERALADSKAELQRELSEKNDEARTLIGDARAAAEKQKAETVHEAHTEAEKLQKDLRERISTEETKARDEVDARLPELVDLLSNKLLGGDTKEK